MTTIILIRHGEKLHWKDGNEPPKNSKKTYIDNHVLSPKGCERAFALVGYFSHREEMTELFTKRPLKALIAQDVDSEPNPWGSSQRPSQTLEPFETAISTGIFLKDGINSCSNNSRICSPLEFRKCTKRNLSALIDDIKSGTYQNQSIIISWSHKQLVELAILLGAPDEVTPKHWPGSRYDITWILDLNLKGNCNFIQMPQRLLYGDKETAME